MEKRHDQTKYNLVITGPESTGKTMIANHLASKYNSLMVPEYARDYIASLQRPYGYEDVTHVAEKQINDYQIFSSRNSKMVIFDTWLIITKIWFQVLYERYPVWIDEAIKQLKIDLYLICKPDIPWEPDEIRENGGEMRDVLYQRYIREVQLTGSPYRIIEGAGPDRYINAEKALESVIKK